MLIRFIKDHIKSIILYFVFALIFAVVFYFYNIPLEPVVYAFVLFGVFSLAYGIYQYFKFKSRHGELMELKDKLPTELSDKPIPISCIEEDYREIIELINSFKTEVEFKNVSDYQDMMDYYSMWVHQIKVPIASMRLMLQSWDLGAKDNSLCITELKTSLIHIEQYVEMVLSYLRMESDSTDYVFEEYELDGIIKKSVKAFSTIFAVQKLSLDYKPVDEEVLTDKKWFEFVLKQIISNALKYTKEGSVGISLERRGDSKVLIVEDTGIGIRAEDIPRVFEKGFTGYNGRIDRKSTGIGLYLCKMIMDKLGHKIWINSEENAGTTVYMQFFNKRLDPME